MVLEHELDEDNGYILTKLVNTFWMSTVSEIGMQQNELFPFYLSVENKLDVVNLQGTDSPSDFFCKNNN